MKLYVEVLKVLIMFGRSLLTVEMYACSWIDTIVKGWSFFLCCNMVVIKAQMLMGLSSFYSGKKSLHRSVVVPAFLHVFSLCYVVLGSMF